MPLGRPSDYNQQTADAICERLAEGESLRSICADEAMPCKSSVFRWLTLHQSFSDQYARAREAQAEVLADEIVEISDDSARDTYIDDDGREVTNHDVIARSRLRVDARKWVASKLRPKVYGDRVSQEVSGPNGGPIQMAVAININPVRARDD